MIIEVWKDSEGYRITCQEAEFDLSSEAFDKLLNSLHGARDEDNDYRIIHLDLPEEEG